MRNLMITLALGACLPLGCTPPEDRDPAVIRPAPAPASASQEDNTVSTDTVRGPLDFTMDDINGQPVPLSRYQGDVVLMVNVASKCGLTPQYKQLQALHGRYADRGLRVLGFPANNFLGQEPGDNKQIQQFCTTRYGVEFDMFSKVSVKGKDICPLYDYLTSAETNPDFAGPIEWNFAKFLIGRDGRVIARFHPRTKPDDAKVVAAIESALATPTP